MFVLQAALAFTALASWGTAAARGTPLPAQPRHLSEATGQQEWRPTDLPWSAESDTPGAVPAQTAADRAQVESGMEPPAADYRHACGGPEDSTYSGVPPEATLMECLGTTTMTRACHFQRVYYDLSTEHFVYFGPEGVTPELFGNKVKRGDPWLRLIRGTKEWQTTEKQWQFFLDWKSGEPPPPEEDVVAFDQPLHLRSPMKTQSLGHLLRDDIMPLIDLALRFGREPAAFDWVRWRSNMKYCYWERETEVEEHYRGLLNNRLSLTWQEVLDKALAGQPPRVKYIRFAEIIAGQGPADLMSQISSDAPMSKLASWAQMCGPFPFTAMREIAYRNHGLEVQSVAQLEPFVLFLDGQADEKRRLGNAPEVIPALQRKFPGVRMEHVLISKYTLEEQLKLLSKATVVVSNIGSRSFRLIYLPNGAHVILVGPAEYEVQLDVEPVEKYKVALPFHEIDSCWGYVGYVKMLQYHVTKESEVIKDKKWKRWQDARASDILLDEKKLTPLLRLALQTSRCSSAAWAGSGTLSAYDA